METYYQHNVKAPFMCRLNQYGDNERHLCVGISLQVATRHEGLEVTMGKSPKKYRISREKLLETYGNRGGKWVNDKGHETIIVPIKRFDEVI